MKNKIVSGYEKKRWYRAVKSLYGAIFAILLIGYNFLLFTNPESNFFWWLIIGNAIIIFGMGVIEGLFWYIACGKWGYPKDEEQENLE